MSRETTSMMMTMPMPEPGFIGTCACPGLSL